MNIVYLIGNGFDLNLGMRTKYEHFYEYYLSLPKNNDATYIKALKESIGKDKENWSDLELALGKYLDRLNVTEAETLHDNLLEHLEKYLAAEEDKCLLGEEHRQTFADFLCNPHSDNRLLASEKTELDNYMSRWGSQNRDIKLINFNYTRTIEKVFDGTNILIGSHRYDRTLKPTSLSGIEHIHGFTDERLILGVNDTSQIANKELHNEISVTDRYIKSDCNGTYGLGHDKKCQQWISRANLICLFGLSFGDTDKRWWEMVGKALKGGCEIILYEYDPNHNFSGNQGPAKKAAKDRVKNRFLKQTDLDAEAMNNVKNNIYVAYNSDMFKFDLSLKETN